MNTPQHLSKWNVWRQDDHGNRFLISSFDHQEEAEELLAKLEARGHKQHYWLDEPTLTPPGSAEVISAA